jgi:hypothetical protein
VVEVLLRHTLGDTPDLAALAPATRELAGRAVGLLEAVTAPEAEVGDSARVTAALYALLDDARRGGERMMDPGAGSQGDEAGEAPPDAPPPGGAGPEDYEQLEMPPFLTPVMEELVRPAPVETSGEGQDGAETADAPAGEGEAPEGAEKAMSTTEAAAGRGAPDEVAQQAEGQGAPEAPATGRVDGRSDDAPGGADAPPGAAADVPLLHQEREEDDLGEQVFHYDEWDHKIEDYRPAWCTLREQRSTRSVEAFVSATFHEYGGIVTQIRRNFQLMRPERLRKMRYQPEGDDLDVDGLVEYVVDRRARVTPSERVYIKRDKKDRDVTTAFLIDMSSSTDRKIDGRKRIIDIEKEGLLLMCEALEAIRDEYAIYGFSGSGRDDCQFYVVKEFGERYDERMRGRIGGIYGRQKTRMGPALRHATKRLMGVDSHVKLLILVTDGKPYDSDTYQDNAYAQEDTKMALREARREKIHLFCVTVDREAADYLPHMYSDANFVIIDDVRTLPHKLPQLYRRLTT